MAADRRRWAIGIFATLLGLMAVAWGWGLRNAPGRSVGQAAPAATQALKPVSAATVIPVAASLTATEQRSIGILHEIVRSKNDNDPRLDQLFRKMSPEMHLALESEYQKLPLERRNARGMIAFLIARDLHSEQDLDFLKSIYNENPCFSVQDCSKIQDIDPHHSGVEQTTANYPQLVTLYQLEKSLGSDADIQRDPSLRSQLRQVLEAAAHFPVPVVHRKAEAILETQKF